eukprot:12733457-Alexandrium_andersonii.AAC.1
MSNTGRWLARPWTPNSTGRCWHSAAAAPVASASAAWPGRRALPQVAARRRQTARAFLRPTRLLTVAHLL